MRIIIARHAIAEDGDGHDARRRLTEEGRHHADLMGRLIHSTLPPPEEIWTSPLDRCLETAQIAARSMNCLGRLKTHDALEPGADPEHLAYLCSTVKRDSLMLVGHAPDVGLLAARLLGFKSEHKLSKGALCIVEIPDPLHPPGRSVATIEANAYAAILAGEEYVPWTKSRLLPEIP